MLQSTATAVCERTNNTVMGMTRLLVSKVVFHAQSFKICLGVGFVMYQAVSLADIRRGMRV